MINLVEHHLQDPPFSKATQDNFVDWHRRRNAALGIWELDRELKALEQDLRHVQEQIIKGKTVVIPI